MRYYLREPFRYSMNGNPNGGNPNSNSGNYTNEEIEEIIDGLMFAIDERINRVAEAKVAER